MRSVREVFNVKYYSGYKMHLNPRASLNSNRSQVSRNADLVWLLKLTAVSGLKQSKSKCPYYMIQSG